MSISGTVHAEVPSIAIREGAASGLWSTRGYGRALPPAALAGSVTHPWEGASCWEMAGVQQSKQPRGAATCKSCPVVSPVLPGAERRRGRRREPRGKGGRRKMDRKGLDGVRRRISGDEGSDHHGLQPRSLTEEKAASLGVRAAGEIGETYLPSLSPRSLCCGLGQAAPGGRCRGLETILRP